MPSCPPTESSAACRRLDSSLSEPSSSDELYSSSETNSSSVVAYSKRIGNSGLTQLAPHSNINEAGPLFLSCRPRLEFVLISTSQSFHLYQTPPTLRASHIQAHFSSRCTSGRLISNASNSGPYLNKFSRVLCISRNCFKSEGGLTSTSAVDVGFPYCVPEEAGGAKPPR